MSDKTETEPVRIPYKSQQVTRFNIVYDEMQEYDDGKYVLWQDYEQLRAEVERLHSISENRGLVPLQSLVWPERLEWEGGWAPVLPEEGIIYIQIKNERMQFQVLNGKKS